MSSSQDQEMWVWKYEPVSPSGTPPLIDDEWLLFDDKSVESPNNAAEPVMYDDHPNRAQAAKKLLEELDEWIKEEPFSDWLEQKIDLPIFEEIPVAPENGNQNKPILYHPLIAKAQQQQDDTQTLLQEFETVLGDVEACHQIISPTSSTLTPPQSPSPHKTCNVVDTQLLVTLQPMQPMLFTASQPIYNVVVPTENSLYASDAPCQWSADNVTLNPLDGDVANELAVVDEYVRSHTKDTPPPSSPCTSSGSSCISAEDAIDDPDWCLESERNSPKRSVYDSSKNRHKPYSRPSVEDKKVRKKEQNKNAATRYRQKKKQEIKEIQGEEHELVEHNQKLQSQVKDLQREIGYLKGLMRDLIKAKGLLK